MRFAIWIFAVLFVAGCASKVSTPGTTSGAGKYSEDLSVLRKTDSPSDTTKNQTTGKPQDNKRNPSNYVEARHAVNQSLDAVLDSIDRINLNHGFVEGYTIQLYSGIQRDDALNIKKQIATVLPQVDADMQFVQPNFRVRAGKYFSRYDAQKDFMAIKKYFPNAIVIPDRIPIR